MHGDRAHPWGGAPFLILESSWRFNAWPLALWECIQMPHAAHQAFLSYAMLSEAAIGPRSWSMTRRHLLIWSGEVLDYGLQTPQLPG